LAETDRHGFADVIVQPDNRVLSRASQAIIDLVPEVCRSLVETGQWPGRLPESDTTV